MADKDTLGDYLHEEALALGADYFGVADLSPARELVQELGGQMIAQFPRAISIGVRMPLDIVDQLLATMIKLWLQPTAVMVTKLSTFA